MEKELLKKIKKASENDSGICHECGVKYGTSSEGEGTACLNACPICGKEEYLLPCRHYGYLLKTIEENK